MKPGGGQVWQGEVTGYRSEYSVASSDWGWQEAKRIAAWGGSGWRLAYESGLPYHFPSKRKGRSEAATLQDERRVASFFFC